MWPVTKDALLEARKTIARAISSDAPQRHARYQCCLPLRRSGETVEHSGLGWTGGYGVDAHAEGGGFERRGLRHTFDGVLAGRVDRRAASALVAYVDEMLTMLPLPWACIARSSCFMLSNVPSTLLSKVAA